MHKAIVVTDLTFGDAGKGTITDALARRGADLVVRYNGGAQAAHTVIDDRGRCHAFHQFGSGTFVEGVETFLSRHMLVNPIALYDEAEALRTLGVPDAPARMHIDARALVTTPCHVILNQLRELARGDARHGSCGLGIGETAADALEFGPSILRFGDLAQPDVLRRKLHWHRELKRRQAELLMPQLFDLADADARRQTESLLAQLHSDDELDATEDVFGAVAADVDIAGDNFLNERMQKPGATVFEGAQGVLLDENRGFHPYTTWSTTTPANALDLIREADAPDVQTHVLGLTRAYQTRHGAGPFPTEDGVVATALSEPHNPANPWQGRFRAGWLDLTLLRYAIAVCDGQIDGLVMTCLDRLADLPEVKIGVSYARDGAFWAPSTEHPGDLDRQEADGNRLREVEVTYEPAPCHAGEYARLIAERLGLSLLGTSHGPKAADKSFAF